MFDFKRRRFSDFTFRCTFAKMNDMPVKMRNNHGFMYPSLLTNQQRHHQMEEAKKFVLSTIDDPVDKKVVIEVGENGNVVNTHGSVIKRITRDLRPANVYDLIDAIQENYVAQVNENALLRQHLKRLQSEIKCFMYLLTGIAVTLIIIFFTLFL